MIQLKRNQTNVMRKMSSLTGLSDSGFTLVEVLIAVFILSIVLAGSLSVVTKCNVFINDIHQLSVASHLLKKEMEEVRDLSFDNVLALDDSFTVSGYDNLFDSLQGAITLDDIYGNNHIRRITITLSWVNSQGRAVSRSITSLISRDGISG